MANLTIEKIGSQNPYPNKENDSELSRALRRFWDMESLGIQDEVDHMRESEFLPAIRFEENEGRYKTQLPWKKNCTPKMGRLHDVLEAFVSTAFLPKEG